MAILPAIKYLAKSGILFGQFILPHAFPTPVPSSSMPLDPRRSRVIKHYRVNTAISVLPALVVQGIFYTLVPFVLNRSPPKLMRTSAVSGAEYIYDVMYCGNPRRIQEILHMKLEVFQFLCIELESSASLSASKFITIEEKVAIFLWTVARSASNRDTQERFQHSGETISRCFHEVLQAINSLVPKYIKLYSSVEIPTAITSNPQYYSFFNDCIGALDGTHIAVKIPESQQAAYRNRKGQLSQNVLTCCDFDRLIFTYVLSGWEGSAHDGAVLEAAFEAGFTIPNPKYYLGDAGFPLTPWCIVPYRGVRYHLREWEKVMNGTISMWKTTLIFLVLKMRRSYLIYVIPVYEMLLKEYLAY